MNRLPNGNIIHTAIFNAGFAKSSLINHLKRESIPESVYELQKFKDQLILVEKELYKLKNSHPKEGSEESEDECEKRKRKLLEYKDLKKKRKNMFNEDEYLRMEIIR